MRTSADTTREADCACPHTCLKGRAGKPRADQAMNSYEIGTGTETPNATGAVSTPEGLRWRAPLKSRGPDSWLRRPVRKLVRE